MLARLALLTIFALPALITSKQIPITNGVFGGVGYLDVSEVKTLNESVRRSASPVTPGKLRVVENSGICGECIGLPV